MSGEPHVRARQGAAGRAEASADAEPAAYLTGVPVVAFQGYYLELIVGDLHSDRVGGGVEAGLDREAGAGGGCCDHFDDGAVGGEGLAPPVHGDEAEQAVFHFEVPGGMWQTVITMPIVAASLASSTLNARDL